MNKNKKMRIYEWLESDLDYQNTLEDIKNNDNIKENIKDDTKRVHANILFNRLKQYSINNEMMDMNGDYIINEKMRDKFYEFLYDNS